MSATAPTKPKRRFLRFSLRTLLLLMLIVGITLVVPHLHRRNVDSQL